MGGGWAGSSTMLTDIADFVEKVKQSTMRKLPPNGRFFGDRPEKHNGGLVRVTTFRFGIILCEFSRLKRFPWGF